MLEQTVHEFIGALLEKGALSFGNFTTKSGRITPYFINFGALATGPALETITKTFAEVIVENFPDTQNVFGPSYKGIPLAAATSIALSKKTGREVSYTFNRKEKKDHGEGGIYVGFDYNVSKPRVVITEDILTAGTSLRETIALLKSNDVIPTGIVVGIDREEPGIRDQRKSARDEIQDEFGIKIASVCRISQIISLLDLPFRGRKWISFEQKSAIEAYQNSLLLT